MPKWVRCRDRETGHEFDLQEQDIRIEENTVEVLKDYEPNESSTARPRPPKHRVGKDGLPYLNPKSPPAESQSDQPEGVPAPDENPPAVTSANSKRSNSNG